MVKHLLASATIKIWQETRGTNECKGSSALRKKDFYSLQLLWYISLFPVEQQAQSNPSEINFKIRSIRITEKRIRGLVRNLPTGLTDNNNTHVAIFYGHSPKIILLQITANDKSCYFKIRVRLLYGECFYDTLILNWQTQVFYLDLLFYKSCYCPADGTYRFKS